MHNPFQIVTAMDWVKVDTDLSPCHKCKEVIFKDMWQLIVWVNYEPIETKYKLCESCYERSEK